MLHRTEPNLRLPPVIGSKVFEPIEIHIEKLELKAGERLLEGYSNNSKNYRICNPATRRFIQCLQLDCNTTFLNADVEEEVYVEMASGYEKFDKNGVSMIMRLLKIFFWSLLEPIELVGDD